MFTIQTLICGLLCISNGILCITYPDCLTNEINPDACHIELYECTDASCTHFTPQSQMYCPNMTLCTTLCLLEDLCSYISAQLSLSESGAHLVSIHCHTITKCKFNASTNSHDQELVIRLDENMLWTILVLSIIGLFGCIICCAARTFWKYHKSAAMQQRSENANIEFSITTSNASSKPMKAVKGIIVSQNRNYDKEGSMKEERPHIVNDEESYMHSLTLAQVGHKSGTVSNPFQIESHVTDSMKAQITPRTPNSTILKSKKLSTDTLDEKDSAETEIDDIYIQQMKQRLGMDMNNPSVMTLEYTSDEDVLHQNHSLTS